jgi:hypothetical protein
MTTPALVVAGDKDGSLHLVQRAILGARPRAFTQNFWSSR